MSAPVDVLAVLASAEARCIPRNADAAKLAEARDAVTELTAAAQHASVVLRALGGPTAGERDEAVARVAAALARVQP